ncbi:hypothetical protein GCM10010145_04730 [Streptomyces ruber]|uniref:HTH cro/C1-type domain-containing protein n=2 Tax=Streptomyces TaxID=1883 RepID=A0A918EQ21_9ACTN|nr:RICIN domain-containing protein [Streptomyces ruber]GGQ39993.1 hypothetical protein GCM10010145_04730 [Streptomyces ruber]
MPGDGTGAVRELARALREAWQRSGRTLRSLEAELPISDSSLSRYLRGTTVPPWNVVRDLCGALGVDSTAYRALWEAANRTQPATNPVPPATDPVPPAADPGPPTTDDAAPAATETAAPVAQAAPAAPATPDVPAPTTTPARRTAAPFRRRLRTLSPRWRGPWPSAVVTGVVGLFLGVALTSRLQPPETAPAAPPPVTPTAEEKIRRGSGAAPNVRVFTSRLDGYCLDDSLDFGLRTYSCNGMSYQRWTVDTYADGTARLRNHATGRCVDLADGGPRAAQCVTGAGGRSQRWRLTTWNDASTEVRHQQEGVCLEESAAGPRTRSCDRGSGQRWG